MDNLEYWKICADFTVVQACLIVCGFPPEERQSDIERLSDDECPRGYVAMRSAFKQGLDAGRIKPATAWFQLSYDGEPTPYYDLERTTIAVEEIDRFLKSRGVVCEFFDRHSENLLVNAEEAQQMPPKLAAAVKAWQVVSRDPVRLRNKSPKQALSQWLLENGAEFGLVDDDGKPNKSGIEEISKIANWKPKGGATPTSGHAVSGLPAARPMIRLPAAPAKSSDRFEWQASIDDDIPF